jgi:hypothetical protein
LINKNNPGAVIGAFLLVLSLIFPGMGPLGSMAKSQTINSETINLEVNEVFSLENTTSVRYDRTFSLTAKQSVSLIHVDCKTSEDSVRNVIINVTLNGVETSEIFEDSTENYYSPHTYIMGTNLTIQIDPVSPVYILSNIISIEITVDAISYFGAEVGDFEINSVIFETFTPPTVTTDSENVPLPLRISEGIWHIAPFTTLKERRLESEVFADISEKVRLRFDITIGANDIPLSLTGFSVSNGYSFVESTELSLRHTIYLDINEGDNIILTFRFRPSSDLAIDIVKLSISVAVTNVPYIAPKNPSGVDQTYKIANIPISVMELFRIVVIAVPLVIFYMRKKNPKPIKKPVKTENIS